MSTSVYNLAKKYYPKLWNKDRIMALYKAGKLTKAEVEDILGEEVE